MLKTIAVLGMLGALGGGTYVAVQKCGSASGECPIEAAITAVGEARTTCCETDAVAKTDKATDAPGAVETPAPEVTKAAAAVEPAAAAPTAQ
jgi:hypothetical protein